MQGEFWTQVQELNKTPLSLACKALVKSPSPNSLYLLQALKEALEEWKPGENRQTNRLAFHRRDSMNYLVDELFPGKDPELVYRVLTTSKELPGEMSDSVLLEKLNREKKPKDKLWALLDNVECNLEDNGYNLSGAEPTVG